MMLEAFGVTEDNWRDAVAAEAARRPTSRSRSHRASSVAPVAALATDPDRAPMEPAVVRLRPARREYGFTDVDGSQPDVWRYIEDSERGEAAEHRVVPQLADLALEVRGEPAGVAVAELGLLPVVAA